MLLTTSCTHALEMAALLLAIKPGDEVIVPSLTFPSTANAFAVRGARFRFCDSRPDTLNLDETLLEDLITPRTKAVVVVHYAGVACELDPILKLCAARRIALIEDNAHGLCGSYRGRALGSFGTIATQSFHETKNLQCGEGGAIVLNSPDLFDRAEVIREKGTNRSAFFRGDAPFYTWVDLGSSYLPPEILAALLVAQLEEVSDIQDRRHQIWDRYDASLDTWAAEMGVHRPSVPTACQHPAHIYYLLLRTAAQRQEMVEHLRRNGVNAVSHYVPLHDSPMGLRLAAGAEPCPVASDVAGRLVRLPLFPGLTPQEQSKVIASVQSFRG